MDLIYIANRSDHVDVADSAGVDRIMVDLEILGKRERQRGRDTVISGHSLSDVESVRSRLKRSSLMVRINPIFEGSAREIDAVVSLGADVVMLPMAKTVDEVSVFVSMLDGRAKASLLLETSEALARAEQILSIRGIDEVHIGLNDLHLALKMDFMFEVLAGGLVDHICGICRSRKLKYGIGGIARLGQGVVPAEDILKEHARLGSTQVILSRDFHSLFDGRPLEQVKCDFQDSVRSIKLSYQQARMADADELAANRARVCTHVARIAASMRKEGGEPNCSSRLR